MMEMLVLGLSLGLGLFFGMRLAARSNERKASRFLAKLRQTGRDSNS
jgi:hypothetical protein